MGITRIAGPIPSSGSPQTALRTHRHPLPVNGVAGNRGIYRTRILSQTTHNHRLIGPGQGVILKLGGQGQVGGIVFRRNDQTTGIPVNPVDNPGPQSAVDTGQGVAAGVEQGVDQGAVRVARGRWTTMPTGLLTTITSPSS